MVRGLAAEQRQPFLLGDPLREHRDRQRDDGHAQQQQQPLLQPDPLAMFAIAPHQKLHRRPLDAAPPHEVDQMDQHRQQGQEESPSERLVNELHRFALVPLAP